MSTYKLREGVYGALAAVIGGKEYFVQAQPDQYSGDLGGIVHASGGIIYVPYFCPCCDAVSSELPPGGCPPAMCVNVAGFSGGPIYGRDASGFNGLRKLALNTLSPCQYYWSDFPGVETDYLPGCGIGSYTFFFITIGRDSTLGGWVIQFNAINYTPPYPFGCFTTIFEIAAYFSPTLDCVKRTVLTRIPYIFSGNAIVPDTITVTPMPPGTNCEGGTGTAVGGGVCGSTEGFINAVFAGSLSMLGSLSLPIISGGVADGWRKTVSIAGCSGVTVAVVKGTYPGYAGTIINPATSNYYLVVTIFSTDYVYKLETVSCSILHLTCSGVFPSLSGCTIGGAFTADFLG